MRLLFSAIYDLLQKVLAIGIISSGILLLAAEVKLAALKKAAEPQSKLSTFTQKMTKAKFLPLVEK